MSRSIVARSVAAGVVLWLLVGGTVSSFAQGARGARAAAIRDAAAELLGGTVDTIAALGSAEDVDRSMLPVAASGAAALEQTLGSAVFAVPVAGNIGYVLRAQVYHDLPLVFPPHWNLVQVFVGDPSRWRVTHRDSFVVVQPGEPAARTNLTAIFASGELLQIDLEELTGAIGLQRTGRAYVGPQEWLVDRIFALMPASVRDEIVERIESGAVDVADLLADPVETIRAQDAFAALPPAHSGFYALDPALAPVGPLPVVEPAVVPADPPEAVEPAEDFPVLVPDVGADPVPDGLRDRFVPALPEESAEVSVLPLPAAVVPDGVTLSPGVRVIPVSLVAAAGGGAGGQLVPAPSAGASRLASGEDVADLERQLESANAARDFARRAAGDRIARATLGIDQAIEDLETDYPARVQFSLLLDPDVPPFTPPFWHLGVWHDGEYTYWRTLAESPVFTDRETGEVLSVLKLDDYLYRLDGVVEEGALIVPGPDQQPRHLFWRRREELEGP